ncbi:polyadenylate-binding protein, cytoplasmic and nuclear [Nematostella vectensis]|nr:polyadenylate-binding protein, cytoplasmic and nuclear [Nematostella vectensis]
MGDQDISKRIFVKGFNRETTESELRAFFEEYGVVKESKIVRDKHGVSKGYAFITFESQEVADGLRDNKGLDFKDKVLSIGQAVRRKSSRSYSRHFHWQSGHRQDLFQDGATSGIFYSASVDGNTVYYPIQHPQFMVVAQPSYSPHLGYPSQSLYQPSPHPSTHLYSPNAQAAMVGGPYVTTATLPLAWNDYTSFNRVRPIASSETTEGIVSTSPSTTSQIVTLAIPEGNFVSDGSAVDPITTQLIAVETAKIKPEKPAAVRFITKTDQ